MIRRIQTVRRGVVMAAGVVALVGTNGAANAAINGFNSGTGWTATASSGAAPTFTANTVTLTNVGVENHAASTFFTTKQTIDPTGFLATFTYQQTATANVNEPGDGVTFVVQNSTAGAGALGDGGGNLGYGGIQSSLAVVLDVNQGSPRRDTTGVATNGNYSDGDTVASDPVVISSGHPILVTLAYDGNAGRLTEVLLDQTNNATFSQVYNNINLNSLIGGNQAFVGFTGANGQLDNTQVISNFTFSPVPEPTDVAAISLAAFGLISRRRAKRA